MNKNIECRLEGCSEDVCRKFIVMKGAEVVDEKHSCGLHDIKVYRQLSARYMPNDYKIELKILEDGKWKNLRT